MKLGNRDLTGADFRWVDEDAIAARSQPHDVLYVERREYGPFIGRVVAITDRGRSRRMPPHWRRCQISSGARQKIARRFGRSNATNSARSTTASRTAGSLCVVPSWS